jgi:hypothetical protein
MNWIKLSGFAMATAVALAALADSVLVVGPALLGHGVAPWRDSAQPRIQAGVSGPSFCHRLSRAYRDNPNFKIPPYCQDSVWFQGVLPPPGDAPPSP